MVEAGQRVPLVTTGDNMPENPKPVMDAGASTYLRKPVDDEALLDAVVTAISQDDQDSVGSD